MRNRVPSRRWAAVRQQRRIGDDGYGGSVRLDKFHNVEEVFLKEGLAQARQRHDVRPSGTRAQPAQIGQAQTAAIDLDRRPVSQTVRAADVADVVDRDMDAQRPCPEAGPGIRQSGPERACGRFFENDLSLLFVARLSARFFRL